MKLQINELQKEVKEHGSYEFPVRTSMENLCSFEQNAFPWHWHPEIELTCIVKGEMYYRINQQEYHVHEGDALFCNTNALHMGSMSNGEDCHYISITFHPRILYGYEGSEVEREFVKPLLNNSSMGAVVFRKNQGQTKEVCKGIRTIYELFQEKPVLYPLQVQIDLLEIWKSILREAQGSKGVVEPEAKGESRDIERLRKILDYIHSRYSEEITLEEIAEEAALCKSECCRFFKKQMGQTLFDYILSYRISMSLSLLKSGYSITEAGLQCGFQNPAYYSRVFKNVMKKSPRAYKSEIKQ